jgi:hypothetical protein
MMKPRGSRTVVLLLLVAAALLTLSACYGSTATVGIRGGYGYGGYYGPSPYWGYGGGYYVGVPVTIGPAGESVPVIPPAPAYDYDWQ